MHKKIFQVMILCGLSASMNEAMAMEDAPAKSPACQVACNALVMYWNNALTKEFKNVECKSTQCTDLYESCYNDCQPK